MKNQLGKQFQIDADRMLTAGTECKTIYFTAIAVEEQNLYGFLRDSLIKT